MSVSPRVFYRIVETNPPTERDFTSHGALGKRPQRPLSPRDLERWHGISTYGSLEAATRKGTVSPWLGSFVARLSVPADSGIRIEQTTRDREHYTIWASPQTLLGCVTSVVEIQRVE